MIETAMLVAHHRLASTNFNFCETDSAAQVINRFKAQLIQSPIHQPKPCSHARP